MTQIRLKKDNKTIRILDKNVNISLKKDDNNISISGDRDGVLLKKENKTLKVVYRKDNIHLKQVRETIELKHTGKTGPQGPAGTGYDPSFETVSKNINAWEVSYSYILDQLTSITYEYGLDTITKTLNYTGDKLTSLVLSGDTPSSIELTKTLSYTGDQLTGVNYS